MSPVGILKNLKEGGKKSLSSFYASRKRIALNFKMLLRYTYGRTPTPPITHTGTRTQHLHCADGIFRTSVDLKTQFINFTYCFSYDLGSLNIWNLIFAEITFENASGACLSPQWVNIERETRHRKVRKSKERELHGETL